MPTCRYCLQPARLVRVGEPDYPYRRDFGPVWICTPCEARVGCHPGTDKPLGGLANAELRQAKQEAHGVFDPIWRDLAAGKNCSRSKARRAAYAWLANELGKPAKRTHIGFMDLEECRLVVEICGTATCRARFIFSPTGEQECLSS